MSPRRVMVDWYSCEGGAGRGYARAGYDVYAVDLFKHENAAGRRVGFARERNPFPAWQGDVLDGLSLLLAGAALPFDHPIRGRRWLTLDDIDAHHASPPCQAYSITSNAHKVQHPQLVEPTREALQATGRPYVIENVEGAPLIDPITLCWSMFHEPGSVLDIDDTPLQMKRHRLFESNVALVPPGPCRHAPGVQYAGSYGGARRDKREAREVRHGGYVPAKSVQQTLLGIDWMTERGMHQALPPVYTEHIGGQLL